MARAATVNDDPLFLEMMADEVVKTWDRYRTGRPLVLSAVNVAPTAGSGQMSAKPECDEHSDCP